MDHNGSYYYYYVLIEPLTVCALSGVNTVVTLGIQIHLQQVHHLCK